MRKQRLHKLTAILSAASLLMVMVCSACPVWAADVDKQADLMPPAGTAYASPEDEGTANVTLDGKSIVIQTVQLGTGGYCGVNIDPSAGYRCYDMNALNGLLISVQSDVPFKFAIQVTDASGQTAFPNSAESMRRYFPQTGEYIDAGTYQDVLIDLRAMCNDLSNTSSVYISRLRVLLQGEGTLTISTLKAAECTDTIGSSLLPESASGFEKIDANGSTLTITDAGVDGYVLTPTNGSWPAVWYAKENKVSLNATLRYNLTVSGYANVLLYFGGTTHGTTTDEKNVLSISSLITSKADSADNIPAGHYAGEISVAEIMSRYKTKFGDSANDFVDNGMVNISCVKIFAVDSTLTVHELSVAEPEAVDGALYLMPSRDTVSSIDALSYDTDGRLVYTASAAGSVTYPIEKYYDAVTYNQLFATVSSTAGFNITVSGVGISASGDALTARSTSVNGDWINTWMNSACTDQDVQANFIGALKWNSVLPDNGIYYVKSVTLQLKAAGTLTVSGLRMDTENYVPTVDPVTLTVGQAAGNVGDIVYVPISLQSVQGVCNLDATVEFDSSVLEPVQQDGEWAVWNDALIGASQVAANYNGSALKIVYISTNSGVNSGAEGVLCTVAFRIKADKSTITPVTLTAGDVQVYNDIDPDEYGASSPVVNTVDGYVVVDLAATTTTTTTTATTTTTTTAAKPTTTTTTIVTTTTTTAPVVLVGSVYFTVGRAVGAAGEIVSVPISIDSTEGICNVDMKLHFDSTLLEPVEQEDGWVSWNALITDTKSSNIIKDSEYTASSDPDTLSAVYINANEGVNSGASGVLFMVNFRLKETVTDTATLIPLTLTVGGVGAYSSDENADQYGAVTPRVSVTDGAVTISPADETTTTSVTTATTQPTAPLEVNFVVDDQDATANSEVEVSIRLAGDTGLANFSAELTFDSNVLKPITQTVDDESLWAVWNESVVGKKAMALAYYTEGDSKLTLAYANGTANTAADGVLCTVRFQVLDGTAGSKTALELSVSDAQYYDDTYGDKYGAATPSAVNVQNGTLYICDTIKIIYCDTDGKTEIGNAQGIISSDNEVVISDFEAPKSLNYSFIGWQIASQTTDSITVTPTYGYVITTVGGKIAETYINDNGGGHLLRSDYTSAYFNYITDNNQGSGLLGYDNRVQVVADEPADGMQFAYWQDDNGNIVSYESTYTIFVPGNLTLTAIFVDKESTVEQTPTVAMQVVRTVSGTDGKGSITWVLSLNAADTERYRLVEYGIYYSPYADYAQLTSDGGVRAKAQASNRSVTYQYSVTISKIAAGKTRAAVGYLIYEDAQSGEKRTVYSANYLAETVPTAAS